ncbi:coiled-coil domain-containing protein 22 [Cucumis melo var. makuwa]|uniref:Coiled-coil domain-containing protein 22 n=1 Tax=Cucumis melo var. makuwa TaxID=1194695 RepID=A0A5A7VC01_CUCMM|nr:coiled-coil domain-containing protein 22 [Cucumis melo var. makuwa]TYK13759.1 coiled-coil domain-containing protein 22 [Cucumis melo var. makuwa]
MEESQEILLNSLQKSSVSIPPDLSSIRNLSPPIFFSICAQVLNQIHPQTKTPFSTSLPDSVADQFKVCSEIASAIKDLGFIGDISFHKFLYPSEEDLYKLIRFLVERLPEASDGKSKVLEDGDGRKEKANTSRCYYVENQPNKTDTDDSVSTHQKVQDKLADPNIIAEETRSPDSIIDRFSDFCLIRKSLGEAPMVDNLVNAPKDHSEVCGNESVGLQGNNRHEVGTYIQKTFEDQAIGPLEEVTTNASELKHFQVELERLEAVTRIVFDDNHSIEFHLQQLEEQINSKKLDLLEMKSQWDAERELLEIKRRSLQESLCARNPMAQEKLKKLREFESEKKLIELEIRRREEENSNITIDLKKQPKQSSRRSYINRVKEITKNSRKQDADIDRILKETRELQLESNNIQERLHRTYAVVDELVLREAKKDGIGKQAHKLLTSIHENFGEISNKILSTDRLRRETAEYEKKIAASASRSLDFNKLQADLDAIRRENSHLEQHLCHKKPVDEV